MIFGVGICWSGKAEDFVIFIIFLHKLDTLFFCEIGSRESFVV